MYRGTDECIGQVTSYAVDDKYVKIEGVINTNLEIGDAAKRLCNTDSLFVGGHYKIVKEHFDSEVRVLDKLKLDAVGFYFDDVYGDKTTKVEVMD